MRIVCPHWARSSRSVDKVEKSLSQCVAPLESPGRREIGDVWTCLKRLRLHISTLPDISFERRFAKVRNPTCRVDNVSSSVQSAAFQRSPLPPRWVPASEILVTPHNSAPQKFSPETIRLTARAAARPFAIETWPACATNVCSRAKRTCGFEIGVRVLNPYSC
jgi:hypothetical protein